MPRVLIHACCGPCSLMPIVHLRDEGWEPALFFFNPNIHPAWEWERRLDALRLAAARLDVPLVEEGGRPDPDAWVTALGGIVQPGARCMLCYRPRLDRTAALAAETGFDAFTSSLLYSRYQQHDIIRREAEQSALRHGAPFLYRDFREWWYDGIRMSRELGLYRQKWCGCVLSMGEAHRLQQEAEQRKAAQKAERAERMEREAEARRLKKEALAARQEAKRVARLRRRQERDPAQDNGLPPSPHDRLAGTGVQEKPAVQAVAQEAGQSFRDGKGQPEPFQTES